MRLSHLLRSLAFAAGVLALTLPAAALHAENRLTLTGAGASFPSPLYQRWFRDYFRAHPEVQVDYQALGSGAGIANFIEGRLDFAGSDLRLTPEDVARVEGGVVQIPMTAGAVVMAYNLPGVEGLRLSREALAGIFLGKVERWDHPLIRASNEGVELPSAPITVVTRVDSSGTSFIVTRHLSAISPELAEAVGVSMSPEWPGILKERGALIRGRGNGGVAAYIKSVPGAVGYVQYTYAQHTNMQMASLQNQAGEFVPASSEAFDAAVASFRAELDPTDLADPRAAGAYPILTLSWLIARRAYDDPRKAEVLRDVIRYCLTDGQEVAALLGYIPLTEAAVRAIMERVERIE